MPLTYQAADALTEKWVTDESQVIVSAQIPASLREDLDELAKTERTSLSQVVRGALFAYVLAEKTPDREAYMRYLLVTDEISNTEEDATAWTPEAPAWIQESDQQRMQHAQPPTPDGVGQRATEGKLTKAVRSVVLEVLAELGIAPAKE